MTTVYKVLMAVCIWPVVIVFLAMGWWKLLGVSLLCAGLLLADWGE